MSLLRRSFSSPPKQGGWVSFVFFLPPSRFFSYLLPPAHVSSGRVGERHGQPSAPCAAVAGCLSCDGVQKRLPLHLLSSTRRTGCQRQRQTQLLTGMTLPDPPRLAQVVAWVRHPRL